MSKMPIVFATGNEFKKQEIDEILKSCTFRDEHGKDVIVGERFNFSCLSVKADEPLEEDLVKMVHHKAISAYKKLLRPCLVEHAGLILKKYIDVSFPGGLTQPMWDSLSGSEGFLDETKFAGEPAIARAVFGYCDGKYIKTYIGETSGRIADRPRGERHFYWDTVFCPDEFNNMTYAEVVQHPDLGLKEKMKVSQSFRALKQFLEERVNEGPDSFFS